VGRNPRRNRLETAAATGIRNECTSSFFERFETAFLTEASYFVDAVRERQPLRLTLDDGAQATRIGIALREALQSKLSVAQRVLESKRERRATRRDVGGCIE
jgi:myo-inositol 2-dehydrogenase / D-chiro-inositol 1-dehydrogenase